MAAERGGVQTIEFKLPEWITSGIERPTTTSQAKRGANQTKTFSKGRGHLSNNISKHNFKSIAKVGLALRMSGMANELVGSFTGNRLNQRRFNAMKQGVQYAIGIAKFGPFGLAYAAGDLGYRSAMYQIDTSKRNREARNLSRLSGNNAFSNRRYGGKML